jgi:glutamate synthase domain-containing protein 3
VVILGPVGPNLAAGMTGRVFVLDPNRQVERLLNRGFVEATLLEEQRTMPAGINLITAHGPHGQRVGQKSAGPV